MCFHAVIFKMLLSVASQLKTTTNQEDRKGWIETTIVVLGGVSTLLASYLHVLGSHKTFPVCWKALLDNFETLIGLNQLEINRAVFDGLRQILTQANNDSPASAKLDEKAVDLVWQLWSRRLPIVSESDENNQDCLLAYISCFKELYCLMRDTVDLERTTEITHLLNKAIAEAHISSYSADVEYMTPLQAEVLESIKLLRSDIEGVPADLIYTVAGLTKFPFADNAQHTTGSKQSQTYVSLSKSSMTLLQSLIATHARNIEVYDTIIEALQALAIPISLKYGFKIQTKSEPLWQHATTSAISIIRSVLAKLPELDIAESTTKKLWSAIVDISNGIIAADCSIRYSPSPPEDPNRLSTPQVNVATLAEEEQFDIRSFETLRDLIIPSLGSPLITDKTRRSFAAALFYTSIIHALHPFEMPKDGEDLLSKLYVPLRGRTVNPLPTERWRMAYVCLEQLADLVEAHEGSEGSDGSLDRVNSVNLAKAAAPYFLLRAGLCVRAYNADQPLRGLGPQPLSQRRELMWVLRRVVKMRSEPVGILDAKGVESGGRKHLVRLYPLLVKSVRAARRDGEVLGLVERCLEIVGGEFVV